MYSYLSEQDISGIIAVVKRPKKAELNQIQYRITEDREEGYCGETKNRQCVRWFADSGP